MFKVYNTLYSFYINAKKENTFTVPGEESKTVSLATSIMKNFVACCSRFPLKLKCCIDFGSASSAFVLLYF